ncbi:MAG: methylenetetrahydrofolate reductase [Veillonellaceae bacterium]|nr:methylenetetrahydrofolate reductase [Veillonellaceae bacterium]
MTLTRISVELVPRNEEFLTAELNALIDQFPVDTVNIPDLLKFDIRSWTGSGLVRRAGKKAIPHIRAIDIDVRKALPMAQFLIDNQIMEVLVLTGDRPQDMGHKIYPSTSVDVIRKFKQELPNVKVYAAIDQYRSSIRTEIDYAMRKLYAGADGFFTQPFYDLRFMEIYAEQLQDTEVFWGISPVVSENSVKYWEVKNNVVFPAGFKPTLEWNINFAKQALDFVNSINSNIYFMPIRIKVAEYLSGIFNFIKEDKNV